MLTFCILGWQNEYVMHNFHDMSLSYLGIVEPMLPPLHGRQITLTTHDTSLDPPPVAIFNWHYIQCVLKKFATPDYMDIKNIYHSFHPFLTRDDVIY